MSPWELAGHVPNARDDMYRLIALLAHYLSRMKLVRIMESRVKGITSFEQRLRILRDFHEREIMFADAEFGSDLSDSEIQFFRKELEDVRLNIKESPVVDYEHIQAVLGVLLTRLGRGK